MNAATAFLSSTPSWDTLLNSTHTFVTLLLFQLFCFDALCVIISYAGLKKDLPLYVILHVISQVPIVCLFATVYYFSIYLRVENIIWPFCEIVFVKGGVLGRKADGTEVKLRTSKWNSLHLIFIFLNDGEMMPIIYASCIAKNGKLTSSVCFVNIYILWTVFIWDAFGEKKATQSCYQENFY